MKNNPRKKNRINRDQEKNLTNINKNIQIMKIIKKIEFNYLY